MLYGVKLLLLMACTCPQWAECCTSEGRAELGPLIEVLGGGVLLDGGTVNVVFDRQDGVLESIAFVQSMSFATEFWCGNGELVSPSEQSVADTLGGLEAWSIRYSALHDVALPVKDVELLLKHYKLAAVISLLEGAALFRETGAEPPKGAQAYCEKLDTMGKNTKFGDDPR